MEERREKKIAPQQTTGIQKMFYFSRFLYKMSWNILKGSVLPEDNSNMNGKKQMPRMFPERPSSLCPKCPGQSVQLERAVPRPWWQPQQCPPLFLQPLPTALGDNTFSPTFQWPSWLPTSHPTCQQPTHGTTPKKMMSHWVIGPNVSILTQSKMPCSPESGPWASTASEKGQEPSPSCCN